MVRLDWWASWRVGVGVWMKEGWEKGRWKKEWEDKEDEHKRKRLPAPMAYKSGKKNRGTICVLR